MLVNMLTVAWILAISLIGPLLAQAKRFRIPVAFGEILVGMLFGASGLNKLPVHNQSVTLLANIGFALVMMVAGSHIDVKSIFGQPVLHTALKRQLLVIAVAIPISLGISAMTHVQQTPLFIVLLSSSSAALILPIFIDSKVKMQQPQVIALVAQVALADLIAVIALPLAINSIHMTKTLFGSLLVSVLAGAIALAYFLANKHGLIIRVRGISKARGFGIELRISLIILLVLAGIAQRFAISIMVAGFALGLTLAFNGTPHRLARQLFAITEGLFAPFFFVWLGAQVNIRSAFQEPRLLLLAALLAVGAIASHMIVIFSNKSVDLSIISAAQLGVPVAAVAIGQSSGALTSGQCGAIMLATLLTIISTLIASARYESRTQ